VFDGRKGGARIAVHVVLLDASRRESAGWFETALIAAQGVGFALFPAFLMWYGAEHPLMWAIAVPCLIVTGVSLTLVAWRLFGREVITIDGDLLRFQRRLGAFERGGTVSLSEVTDAVVVPCGRADLPNNAFGVGHAAVLVRSAHREVRCGLALAEPQAADLADRIRAEASEVARRRTRG